MLVAFEFTGAVLMRVLKDERAISVDTRPPTHNGPSFQGDIRDAVHVRMWKVIFFVGPNCYQHMRLDKCLDDKIQDCRAFWGAAMVIWCICCAHAIALLVEQPDTIVEQYRNKNMPGVRVIEVRAPKCRHKTEDTVW